MPLENKNKSGMTKFGDSDSMMLIRIDLVIPYIEHKQLS